MKTRQKGNNMNFDHIADLERKKQRRSIDKIIDCCTKLGIDRSHVGKDGSASRRNRNRQVLVKRCLKLIKVFHYPLRKVYLTQKVNILIIYDVFLNFPHR